MTVALRLAILGAIAVVVCSGAAAGRDRTAAEAQTRVDHHLRQAEPLVRHFEARLAAGCPRFATAAEWSAYLDGEVHRLVLLLAHLGEAWTEARQTGDDDVRRSAKSPRKRHQESALELLRAVQACAAEHGSTLPTGALRERIEREVPQRRAEIALPQ